MALPRELRLRKSSDFKATFARGKKLRGEMLTLYFKPNGLSHNRVGCSASTSRTGTLVRKNRLQRLIRESFRRNTGMLSGYDFVWALQKRLARVPSFKEIETEVRTLLSKTGEQN